MNSQIKAAAQRLRGEITGISSYIFSHPELGDCEFKSSAFLAEVLRRHGFRVQQAYCGLTTSFRADLGAGETTVAFLPEYDALPGYGPEHLPAHACGHNWIAASTVGAALLLAEAGIPASGAVAVIGSPAEETAGRKVNLLNAGAFRDIDAAFQMHLGRKTNLRVSALAIEPLEFSFCGKASHAAARPFCGINALDAVNLTFAGIGALRQQLKPEVRIHGVVTDGGGVPNVIPAHAACRFYVRAQNRIRLAETAEKVKNCARGAALMTGTQLAIREFENSFDDLTTNLTLSESMAASLRDCGIELPHAAPESTGSTDLGNVSHSTPTFYGHIGVGDGTADAHEEAFLQYVDSDDAHEKLVQVAQAFAETALAFFSDASLRARAREEFLHPGADGSENE